MRGYLEPLYKLDHIRDASIIELLDC